MSTVHIAASPEQVAPAFLMPGDPLRARFIAENFLTDVTQFNQVRNMLGYTGNYKGQRISVMGSGMGMPSMGIYAHELFTQFRVERIIRIGSCGAYTRSLQLFDLLLADDAWSESTFAQAYSGSEGPLTQPSPTLNQAIKKSAEQLQRSLVTGRIHSTDVFYRQQSEIFRELHRQHGCLAVEMEAFALFHIAAELNKQAACLLTVSDCLETGAKATSQQREKAFTGMIEVALNAL